MSGHGPLNDEIGVLMKMTAAVVASLGSRLYVTEVEVPTPGPGQALVRNIASGVCHTDLHAAKGDWPVKPTPPFIPGHEGVGLVEKVGEGVTNLQVGDLVGNAWLWSACGQCEFCRTGWETLCESQENGGYSVDGSFGEYMLVDATYAAALPEGVDAYEIAPILCAGVTVYKGLKQTEVRPGQWVVVSGLGGLGHLAVQYAKAMGMKVIGVDIAPDKLDLATRHGADLAVNAAEEDPVAFVRERIGGAHGVLVTAVHPAAFTQAVGMARRGGTIVFNGLPAGTSEVSIVDVVLGGLTIRGSIVGTRQDMVEAVQFYVDGHIHPRIATRSIEDINEIFDEMERGEIDGRVVIRY